MFWVKLKIIRDKNGFYDLYGLKALDLRRKLKLKDDSHIAFEPFYTDNIEVKELFARDNPDHFNNYQTIKISIPYEFLCAEDVIEKENGFITINKNLPQERVEFLAKCGIKYGIVE